MDRPKSVVGVIKGVAYVLFPFLYLFPPPSTLALVCLPSLCLISLSLSLSLSLSFSLFFSLSLFVWKYSDTASLPSSLRIAGAFCRMSSECATPYVSRYVWEWFNSSSFAAFCSFLVSLSLSLSLPLHRYFSPSLSFPPTLVSLPLSLWVEFYGKLMVGIPGMRKLLHSPWQTLRVPFALTPIGQLHQSPPSFFPRKSNWMCTNEYVHIDLILVRNFPHSDRKQKNMNKASKNQRKKHGGDGKRRPLIPSSFPASWSCHPPAI